MNFVALNKIKFMTILSIVVVLMILYLLIVLGVPAVLAHFVLLPILGVITLGWVNFFIVNRCWSKLLIFLTAVLIMAITIYFGIFDLMLRFLGIK